MRSEREFSETPLQIWEGNGDEDLMVEVSLKRAMGMNVPEGSMQGRGSGRVHVDSAMNQEDEIPIAMSVRIHDGYFN